VTQSHPVAAAGGWELHNIWQHSRSVRDLYIARARNEAEEMVCAAQAAEMLQAYALAGETLLDIGCGTGYFLHSLRRRSVALDYHGIDATKEFIDAGRRELAQFGLPETHLQSIRIEDLSGKADHVLCMNVLSNIDNFHKPLERLLAAAGKSIILRESIAEQSHYNYVRDEFLDEGVQLSVHVNTYSRVEIQKFIEARGFRVTFVRDRRTGGAPEMVIGYPHHWTFVQAHRLTQD
jgi:cyclopropane fatty-acyl-phospholipid synthase-like methyltransferase